MKNNLLALVLIVLLAVLIIAGSCARRLLTTESAGIWTPAPMSGTPLAATRPAEILPGLAPTTATRPTLAPTMQPAAAPSPTLEPASEPSPDPKLVIVTEEDVLSMVAGGMAGEGGASLEGVKVDFVDEKMILSATRVAYGAMEVRELLLVGRLTASEGRLQLEVESVEPRGLMTALIPTFANQALAQYTSQWYVEEVRTTDGQLELRIR